MRNLNQGSSNRGFTLIELMVVIAIVAVLVTLAVPAYQDYTIRSKVTECIGSVAVAKIQISEYRQTLGAWPPNDSEAGINTTGASTFCNTMSNYLAASGSFTVDVREAVVDSDIAGIIEPRLTPTVNASNNINWNCTVGNTSPSNIKYLPASCRDT